MGLPRQAVALTSVKKPAVAKSKMEKVSSMQARPVSGRKDPVVAKLLTSNGTSRCRRSSTESGTARQEMPKKSTGKSIQTKLCSGSGKSRLPTSKISKKKPELPTLNGNSDTSGYAHDLKDDTGSRQ